MTVWHKNGTEDMTQWTKCHAPEACTCNTDWSDREMCASSTRPLCERFVMCENYADTTRNHPVRGNVPICNQCDEKINKITAR